MTIVNAPPHACPVEMVLEPQRDPMRGDQLNQRTREPRMARPRILH